jgi:hypothetical protein
MDTLSLEPMHNYETCFVHRLSLHVICPLSPTTVRTAYLIYSCYLLLHPVIFQIKEPGRRSTEVTPAPRVGPSEGAARPGHESLHEFEHNHQEF